MDLDGATLNAAAQLVKQCGGCTLHFCKVSVIGQGRAGKSTLISSILGHDFKELESTAGVQADMYEVIQHHVKGVGEEWAPYNPVKGQLLAEAQARMIAGYMLAGNEGLTEISQQSVVDILPNESADGSSQLSQGLPGEEEQASLLADETVGNHMGQDGIISSPLGTEETTESGPDTSLIQQFLDYKGGNEESLKLLLEDFGGQDCFYELYSILFSQRAVYVLVFNMEWFVHGSDMMTEGLAYLRHWLLTVQVYCQKASIILVGTHKDKVQDRNVHEKISDLLAEQLCENPAWEMVVEISEFPSESGKICFFPVDNTLGKKDSVIGALMRQIEVIIKQSEHFKFKIPFAWFALLDKIQELKQARKLLLTYQELCDICKHVGFPSNKGMDIFREVQLVLDFFTKLGLLLYHPAIPHLVIMRPAEFLFPYFTRFICDFKLHSFPEHKKARRRFMAEFKALETRGVLSADLLKELWSGNDHQDDVGKLMVCFGLIVEIQDKRSLKGNCVEYLVPSILPQELNLTPPESTRLTAFAFFAVMKRVNSWERDGFFSVEDVKKEAQVPDGVFSRLIGAVASLCQQIPPNPSIHKMQVSKNLCAFHLGEGSFTIINHKECIGIYIVKGGSHEIIQMLDCQIRAIVIKFVPGFDFRLCLPSTGGQGLFPYTEVGVVAVLTGENGIKAREGRGEGMVVSPNENLSVEELRHRFCDWIMKARGGALTSDEEEKILSTAAEAKPVSTGKSCYDSASRMVGNSDLHTGRAVDTVLGLDILMNTSHCLQLYHQRCMNQEMGIEEEVSQLKNQKALDVLRYVIDAEVSDGFHDVGREDVTLESFVKHSSAKAAELTRAEVVALRLYTTLAYHHINDPLRSAERRERNEQCLLAATTRFAYEATRKLRALNTGTGADKVLWRGMRGLRVTDDFLANGGTELGFMSATRHLEVAVRYALSRAEVDQALLLFKILVSSFVSSGADLSWVSAFPREGEVLFPPLTFLKPTGRVDRLEAPRGGQRVCITVVEVVPYVG